MQETLITLGGRSFTVRALPIAALRKIETVTFAAGKLSTDMAAEIIAAGLAADYPDYDLETEFRGKITELSEASRKILALSGLIPEDAPVGEAPAAATAQ